MPDTSINSITASTFNPTGATFSTPIEWSHGPTVSPLCLARRPGGWTQKRKRVSPIALSRTNGQWGFSSEEEVEPPSRKVCVVFIYKYSIFDILCSQGKSERRLMLEDRELLLPHEPTPPPSSSEETYSPSPVGRKGKRIKRFIA